jgi:membrane protease YdiL (CAAX protease family)
MTQLPESQRGLLLRVAKKIMPRSFSEALVFAALACTAGLAEEFLYRGFVFAVFVRVFANSAVAVPMAVILSSSWFGVGHLYQGKRGVITTFIVGILFSLVRVGSGSLIPTMAAHAGIDLMAGIGASRFLSRDEV